MKQQAYTNAVEGTSSGVSSSEFSIRSDSAMFRMLTSNVYNDPIKAVIREWSTNACDACIDAGKEIKFEAHLPTLEEPTFSIRDYGTGLHPDDVSGIFCELGASTKRGSDAFNGCLGIGRMAGLAVADAFTVESFYEGTHYTFVVSLDNGIPVLLSLGTTATGEPNGLKLSVAVDSKEFTTFRDNAEEIYKYFDHKPIVNLDINTELLVKHEIDAHNMIVEDSSYYSSCKVVMSQVCYTIPHTSEIDFRGFSNVTSKIPAGSVTFNPGRESLSLDKPTVAYINKLYEDLEATFKESILTSFAVAANDFELAKTYQALSNVAPYSLLSDIGISEFFSTELQAMLVKHRRGLPRIEKSGQDDIALLYKPTYNKLGKYVTINNNLSMSSFIATTHIINDLKTRFKPVLDEVYNGKSYVVWSSKVKKDLTSVVEKIETLLTTLGLPFIRMSELVKEHSYLLPAKGTAKGASRLEGFYASRVTVAGIGKAELMHTTDIEDGNYLYLKLLKNNPELRSTSHTMDDYLHMYKLLAAADSSIPPIRGVNKKYQSCVDDLDNWIDFETYIEEKVKTTAFRVSSPPSVILNPAYINTGNCYRYPKDIQEWFLEQSAYNKFLEADNAVKNSWDKKILKDFNASTETYTPSKDIDLAQLEATYPMAFSVLTNDDRPYQHIVLVENLPYIATLEKENAICTSN